MKSELEVKLVFVIVSADCKATPEATTSSADLRQDLAPFEREIMDLKALFAAENVDSGYRWCQDRGLMPKHCPDCNEPLEISSKIKEDTCVGYCSTCQSTCDPKAGTWFEACGLEPWQAIALIFYWSVGYTYPQGELKYALLQHDFRNNPIRCFNWCQTKKLLRRVCPKCPSELLAKHAQLGGNIRCGSCGHVTHAFRGTWFEDLNCAPWQALGVMHHFATGDSAHKAAKKLRLAVDVAAHWYDKCQVVAQANLRVCTPPDVGRRRTHFDDPQDEYDSAHYVQHKYQTCPRFMVGGYGKVVEVDLVPVDKIFRDEWGLLIVEKDTWRCCVLGVRDPTADCVTRSLKGRVRENTKVYCNFVEAGSPDPQAKTARGAAPFDVNDDGDLVPDAAARRRRLVGTEHLLRHVLDSLGGRLVGDPDELQTALVQFMWVKAFAASSDTGAGADAAASDVGPFMTFVGQVARFFRVGADADAAAAAGSRTPAGKLTYTIDRRDGKPDADSDAEKEEEDDDEYLRDFAGKSPFDSGVQTPAANPIISAF